MDAFQEFDWPGNVRELENVLIKAVALCPGDMITLDLLPDAITRAAAESMDAVAESVPVSTMSLEEVEKRHVMRVLEVTKWHRGQACEILGVSRPRLRRMIRQYGLIAPDYAAKDDA
jgi:DNA-binding NtrC family response regulator